VLYFESIANPSLKVANTPELARIAHKKGVTVVVDNTFAPMVLSPARLGADVVVHSVSKFISGGGDVIAGFPLRLFSLSHNHSHNYELPNICFVNGEFCFSCF
jgi:cystathionine beta-lyase/cystathionine gamma-synthase